MTIFATWKRPPGSFTFHLFVPRDVYWASETPQEGDEVVLIDAKVGFRGVYTLGEVRKADYTGWYFHQKFSIDVS